MSLTRSVLCGMIASVMAIGCAGEKYSLKSNLGVDNRVNFERPAITASLTTESK